MLMLSLSLHADVGRADVVRVAVVAVADVDEGQQ